MAFSDFLDLRTAVAEYVGQDDIVEVFPRLVLQAEMEMSRRMRCREQMTETSLAVSSGSVALPSDFQETVGLFTASGVEYVGMPVAAYERLTTKTGFYTIEGSSLYASDATYTLKYYQTVPTITDSMTDTNWVLSKHPNLYLYAVGFEAARYLKDAELSAAAYGFREQEFARAATQDSEERFARSRVRVGGVVV